MGWLADGGQLGNPILATLRLHTADTAHWHEPVLRGRQACSIPKRRSELLEISNARKKFFRNLFRGRLKNFYFQLSNNRTMRRLLSPNQASLAKISVMHPRYRFSYTKIYNARILSFSKGCQSWSSSLRKKKPKMLIMSRECKYWGLNLSVWK